MSSDRVVELRDDGGKASKDKDKDKDTAAVTEKAAPAKTSGEASTSTTKSSSTATAAPVKSTQPAPATAPKPAFASGRERAASATLQGNLLSDDALTQIAQQKFEAQEDKLRDVVRHTVVLIREFPKLSDADCDKKIGEIRKCLVKYEMQSVRVAEVQEKRRIAEIGALDEEASRCRSEAEVELATIAELQEVLEKEKRRRKRYEGYEEYASEVNRKKSRSDTQAGIDTVTEEIGQLKKQREELEAMIEERNQRAQLLHSAVAELAVDLRRESAAAAEALKACGGVEDGTGHAVNGSPSPNGVVEIIS